MRASSSRAGLFQDNLNTNESIILPKDLRESPRFPFTSAVMFENYSEGTFNEGRMLDYSRGGMRFETNSAPQLGREIFIGMDKSPYSSEHDVFRAEVVWLREQPLNESSYPFTVGVKYR
jgi:hypothetical protein